MFDSCEEIKESKTLAPIYFLKVSLNFYSWPFTAVRRKCRSSYLSVMYDQINNYIKFSFKNLIQRISKVSSMPTNIVNKKQEYVNQLIKESQKYESHQLYSQCEAIYNTILRLSLSKKNYEQYIAILMKLSSSKKRKNFDYSQVLQLHYQNFVQLFKSQYSVVRIYIKHLEATDRYSQMKDFIRKMLGHNMGISCNGLKLEDESLRWKDKQILQLYAFYARSSHRLLQFQDALDMIGKLEQINKGEFLLKFQKLLIWKIYLDYQEGNYSKAIEYSSKIIDSPVDQKQYYYLQLSKYYLLNNEPLNSIKYANLIIEREKVELRYKLKAFALKAYSQFQLNLGREAHETLKLGLKQDSNDLMLQLKFILFRIIIRYSNNTQKTRVEKSRINIVEEVGQLKTSFQSLLIMKRFGFVIKKFNQCQSQKEFDDGIFSEHYNWFAQFVDYRANLTFYYNLFLTLFEHFQQKCQVIVGKSMWQIFEDLIYTYSKRMFYSLIQGYNDCMKSNIELNKLQARIKGLAKQHFGVRMDRQEQKKKDHCKNR